MPDVPQGVVYIDTSALVKLVVREAESDALKQTLSDLGELATSAITSIELARAVARARVDATAVVADDYTILALRAALAEIPLDVEVRSTAASLTPIELRTLDAIHLASALTLGDDLAAVLAYDKRMQDAAPERSASSPQAPAHPADSRAGVYISVGCCRSVLAVAANRRDDTRHHVLRCWSNRRTRRGLRRPPGLWVATRSEPRTRSAGSSSEHCSPRAACG